MSEITIRVSTGQEGATVSGTPPTPMSIEQVQMQGMMAPVTGESALPPVPSTSPEGVAGLPAPMQMEQGYAAAPGGGPLPAPMGADMAMGPGALEKLPVPMEPEQLQALYSSPAQRELPNPEEISSKTGGGRKTKK
ncbi:MAG TPA: hypothetical protein VLA49_07710 [Anaerolineales bacterium]|nr:hypothetical protein [Anaerolineales bacterium]